MISPRATWKLLRAGNLRARLRATRDGQAAIRLHLGAAALATGVVDALAARPGSTAEVAERIGARDVPLLEAFLRVLAAAGVARGEGTGPWQLTGAGRAMVDDDLVRASFEAFGGFHTELYRALPGQLAGGPARRDVVERGGLIARTSAAFDPFVDDLLTRTVTAQAPGRVLDVGCGAGLQLAGMLRAAPHARGVGLDAAPAAAALARQTLERQGLAGRASVLCADVRALAAGGQAAELGEPFDLALLANAVYYVPAFERVALLRAVAGLLAPGGRLLVVTTAATAQLFSRHFDLLLRAQEGRMELPDADGLCRQLAEAGLAADPPRALAPGTPLIAVTATPAGRPAARQPA